MFRSGIRTLGIAALTAAMLAFSASPLLAAPRGGGGGGGRGGAGGGFRGGSSGFRGGSSYRGGYGGYGRGGYGYGGYGRGYGYGGYGWGGYGLGLGGGYYGGYYGGYDGGYPYYSDSYYAPGYGYNSSPLATTSSYYNPDIAAAGYSAPSRNDMTATVAVHVPADAKVWFDDSPTQQTGGFRQFATPPLESGKVYHYDIHAQWTDNGKTIDRTQRVEVRAGSLSQADFMQPNP